MSLVAAVVVVGVIGLAWTSIRADREADLARPVPTSSAANTGTGTGTVGGPSDGASPPPATGAPDATPAASAPGSPLDDWWRRVPPVAGRLIWIDRYAEGRVRIDRDGDRLVVHFEDLVLAAYDSEVRSARVVLSEGTVVGERRGYWSQEGRPYEVGAIPSGRRSLSIDVPSPSNVPDAVRSIVLLDADTGEVLGGAPLLPVGSRPAPE
ncbi:hypothetical protein ACTJKO_14340 [Curtobacterium sp. 22159]|uniref:hypothetical protein n=1 Tax=Curtobacterium sp. 22159 TaxID=3453882 RepID=UPI003F87A3D9